jgi:dihydroflavonol-4-reductase
MPKAFLTGATGFIGSHVASSLLQRGYEVVCLVRSSSAEIEGCQPWRGDIMDPASLETPIRDADLVIHSASLLKMPWKQDFVRVNVEGTRNVAAAAAKRPSPPPVVVVSSLAAAGPASAPHREDGDAMPISIYGAMKLSAERAASEHADRAPITIVRPPMVYGPNDRYGLDLFRTVTRGIHAVPTFRDHRLSLIHAADLADLLITAGERGERIRDRSDGLGLYYAAHDERPTYADLGRWVAEASGAKRPIIVRLPASAGAGVAAIAELAARLRDRPSLLNRDKWREATAGSWTCDASKAKQTLGFSPRAAFAGLAETADWYRKNRWLA